MLEENNKVRKRNERLLKRGEVVDRDKREHEGDSVCLDVCLVDFVVRGSDLVELRGRNHKELRKRCRGKDYRDQSRH